MKKFVSLLLALVVTLSMSFSVMTVASFAEESNSLKVVVQKGDVSKEYDLSTMELKDYTFSIINNGDTVEARTVKGVLVSKLLKDAGITFGKNEALEINCVDYDPEVMNYSDLMVNRYCYTNITKLNALKGIAKVKAAKKQASSPVLAVESVDDVKLYFGQAYITERNLPKCLDNVYKIVVTSKQEKKQASKPEFMTASTVEAGSQLDFVTTKDHNKQFIHYSVDGKNPTVSNSRIYNCVPKAKPDPQYNKYTFKKVGYYTVKAVVKSCLMKDSAVASQKFTVKPAKAEVTELTAGKTSATVKIKSQKSSGVTGYEVSYQKDGSTKWNSVKTTKTSCKLTKLKKGNSYYVKVRAYAKVKSGKKTKTLYGAYGDVEVVAVKL